MTTALVRNNTKIDLSLPNGSTVKAGKEARIENWQNVESADNVKAWLQVKALEVLTDKTSKRAVKEARATPRPDDEDDVRKTGPADLYVETEGDPETADVGDREVSSHRTEGGSADTTRKARRKSRRG